MILIIHTLPVAVARSQLSLLVDDIEMIFEYVPVDPYMIDGVFLSFCMDEYQICAWEL